MAIYEPFSVVVVPFPLVEKHKSKRRPAIVLSSKEHQRETHHVTLLMITSATHTQWVSDIPLIDLKSAGLSKASVVRQKIFTIDTRLIIRLLGKITEKDHKEVVKKLKSHLVF